MTDWVKLKCAFDFHIDLPGSGTKGHTPFMDHKGRRGVVPAAFEHDSLHVTLEALQAVFPWHSSNQIVQLGHWIGSKKVHDGYLARYGNPWSADSMPLGAMLVATELWANSFEIFETCEAFEVPRQSEHRYQNCQNVWFPVKCETPSIEWTPGPPRAAVVVYDRTTAFTTRARVAFWEAHDAYVRQKANTTGLVAWHMIFVGTPFVSVPGFPSVAEAFESKDLYWTAEDDKFSPKPDVSKNRKLCAACREAVNGLHRDVPALASALDDLRHDLAAGLDTGSDVAPERLLEEPHIEGPPEASTSLKEPIALAPIEWVLSVERPWAHQEAVDALGPRALLYVASRGPADLSPPDFESMEMQLQPQVTWAAIQSVIRGAYSASRARLDHLSRLHG